MAGLTRILLDLAVYDVEILSSAKRVLVRAQQEPRPDAVLLDMGTLETEGLQLIADLRRARPFMKIVVLSSGGDLNRVVRAVHLGADGCIRKSLDPAALTAALRECLPPAPASPLHPEQPGDVEELDGGGFFVMASAAMRRLRAQLDQVAKIDVSVFCLGESGTGKEVIARQIHRLSNRARRPFLKVNCAAMPFELLESELFGHERGAFTGAVRAKPGKFELANNGTLFLDEIAEMPPALQAKLLHVLQDQEFTRLGGCSRVKVDVRVIAATNVNITEALANKKFREDLYYRLSAFVFSIPPLRERKEDMPVLLRRYLKFYSDRLGLPERELSSELWKRCLYYGWPGNVRELENFAKRYLLLGEGAVNFASEPAQTAAAGLGNPTDEARTDIKTHARGQRNDVEVSVIARALETTNWNRKEAARILNISYKSLLSKIRQHGIDKPTRNPSLRDYDAAGALLGYANEYMTASSSK